MGMGVSSLLLSLCAGSPSASAVYDQESNGATSSGETSTTTYTQLMSDEEIEDYLSAHPKGLLLEDAFRENSQSDRQAAIEVADESDATGTSDNLPSAGDAPSASDLEAPNTRDVPNAQQLLSSGNLNLQTLAPGTATPNTQAERRGACVFVTDGDNPHRSGGFVSAHGYWYNYNCKKGTRANVTNWVAMQTSDGKYYLMAVGYEQNVRPGGGKGKRSTAKYTCERDFVRYWRNLIDVDLVGQPDSPEVAATEPVTVVCA